MDTRSAIVASFERLVEAATYDEVTVEQVCRASNISRRTFYRYFDGKQAVLASILESDLIKPVHDIHELIDSDNLKSSSTIIYRRALGRVFEKRGFYRKVFTREHPELMAVYIDMVVAVNRESKGLADLSRQEADFAAYVIAVSSTYAMARWLEQDCAMPIDEQTRLCLRWIYGRFREMEAESGRWRLDGDGC